MVVTVDGVRKAAAASRSVDMLWSGCLRRSTSQIFRSTVANTRSKNIGLSLYRAVEYFKVLVTSSFKEGTEQKLELKDDETAVVARLLYFLYTGRCSINTPLKDLEIEQFREIDESVYSGKDKLYCAQIYAIAVRLLLTDLEHLAACEYRCAAKTQRFYSWELWRDLVSFVYNSTPSTARALKDMEVRDWQVFIYEDRDRMLSNVKGLNALQEVIRGAPDFGFDIATMPLVKHSYRYSECKVFCYVARLRCNDMGEHNCADKRCFQEGLKKQDCHSCFATDVLDGHVSMVLG